MPTTIIDEDGTSHMQSVMRKPEHHEGQGEPRTRGLEVDHVSLGHRASRGGDLVLAVDDLDFAVEAGEFVVIVGPSGCGKTTFLEALAGLVPVHDGTIRLSGTEMSGPGRDRSLVFQNASLFPWRDVTGNVLFSLQAQRRITAGSRDRAAELIRLVGLEDASTKYPHELSGGMKQRVNLARALVTDPTLLLLDEPFGALDAQTREVMQAELVRVWQAEGASSQRTAVFVTHDVNEAVFLADRVLVFSAAPARVVADIKVAAPRPREAEWKRSQEFIDLGDQILEALYGTNAVTDDEEAGR